MSESARPSGAPHQALLVEAARASYVRRAEVRRRLKHTNTDVRALLTGIGQTHPAVRKMSVRTALAELPNLSRAAVDRLLTRCNVDGTKSFASLSVREGHRIADLLDP